MQHFLAVLISGLNDGSIYVLMALGIVLLQNATGVINFAQGDLMTLGAYIGFWWIVQRHGNQWVMYLVTLVLLFGAGVLLERVGYAPLRKRPPLTILISTFALGLLIRALLEIWQGTEDKSLPSPFGLQTVTIFGVAVTKQAVFTICVTAVLGLGLFVFFQRSPVGRQVRALATDREAAILQGVRVRRLSPIIFGLSAALAGLAGVLFAPQQGGFNLLFGYSLLLNAFAAVILGGERLGGVAIAALGLAVAQQMATAYLWPNYSTAYPYVILIVVLALRPQGLVRQVGGVRY